MKSDSERTGEAAVAGAAPGSAALTFATLAAMMSEIPKPPPWRYCTVKPEHAEMLRREIPPAQPGQLPIVGIEIHENPGQVADSWMFRDSKTLRKYLAGELSELDLMGLMETGACQPNAEVSQPEGGKEQ